MAPELSRCRLPPSPAASSQRRGAQASYPTAKELPAGLLGEGAADGIPPGAVDPNRAPSVFGCGSTAPWPLLSLVR
eukprot:1502062-Prymnesium_polylepis.1